MIIDKKQLTEELKWAAAFAAKKTAIPILSQIRLDAMTGGLTLAATNLETGGITLVPAATVDEWALTVPPKPVLRFLEALNGVPSVSLTARGAVLDVEADGAKASFNGMSAEAFPEIPEVPVSIGILNLDWAVPRVACAISAEESRFTLNRAKLEIGEDGSRLVATDGHRLSLVDITTYCPEGAKPVSCLVRKFALLKAAELGQVAIGENDDFIRFATQQRSIVSRKLTGNFPDYKRVIPSGYHREATVSPAEWVKALKRMRPFVDDRSLCVRLTLDGDATFYAETTEMGQCEAHVPCTVTAPPVPENLTEEELAALNKWVSEPTVIGLNLGYLNDFLSKAPPDGVVMEFKGAQHAVMLTYPGVSYVLSPMRI